ncbi:TonB-dependent receptor [Fulvitalea axinellae]|uniref:TonB-dependent receptor n=1 Tax=Fulvitalea axinellae TaxID=1182444 RepID=A0AAU9D9C9_9BACT|nr:TonB-dependent receptor [Fulvitalea axinellae]
MIKKKGTSFWVLIALTISFLNTYGSNEPAVKGQIKGKVVEKGSGEAVSYATIAVFAQDNSLVGGAITDDKGAFVAKGIKPGVYDIEAKFVGFETVRLEDINVRGFVTDVGVIELGSEAKLLEGVEVTATRPEVEYKIDRKVINVDKMVTSLSGSAVDILDNVPSVEVDIDGNVSLRGSSDFTVFIDGRPSVFKGSDALSQIPASMIANIEIITNPSAKYDPDGTSGIINIITKKKASGFSGVANVNAGYPGRYGADAMFSYKANEKFTYHLGGDFNSNQRKGTRYSENTTFGQDTVLRITDGDRNRESESFNLKGGIDFTPNKKNRFSLMMAGGKRENVNDNEYLYSNYLIRDGVRTPADNPLTFNTDDGIRSSKYASLDFDYVHKFDAKSGHELSMSAHYGYSEGDEDNQTYTYGDREQTVFDEAAQRSTEDSEDHSFRYRIDYTRPVGEHAKFEAGYQVRMNRSDETNGSFNKSAPDADWKLNEKYSYLNEFTKDIHAIYGTFAGELDKFGYQLGLRGEYTYRQTKLVNVDSETTIDRFDIFPTAHFSYQLPAEQQLMASYSRRINRPANHWLEPFPTYMDAYNVRIGDPGIEPEYVDSYEVGYTKNFDAISVSAEAFYKKINNRTEFVKEVWNDPVQNPDGDIFMNTRTNVGIESNYGLELMLNADPFKWWSLSFSGTFSGYDLDGSYKEQVFDRSDFYYNFRMSNDFLITESIRFQVTPRFMSGRQSTQGERESFFYLNLAVKQDFMDKQFSATLQARNVLNSFKWEYTSYGPDFASMSRYEGQPSVALTLTYRINNYRPKRSKNQGGGGGEGGGFEM